MTGVDSGLDWLHSKAPVWSTRFHFSDCLSHLIRAAYRRDILQLASQNSFAYLKNINQAGEPPGDETVGLAIDRPGKTAVADGMALNFSAFYWLWTLLPHTRCIQSTVKLQGMSLDIANRYRFHVSFSRHGGPQGWLGGGEMLPRFINIQLVFLG